MIGCTYDTVKSRTDWLAVQARKAHEQALASGRLNTSWMQFDEMMTFEHARSRTLGIALVVRGKTAEILSIKVGRIPSSGHLATIGKTRYAWTVNEGPATCRRALEQAAIDEHPSAIMLEQMTRSRYRARRSQKRYPRHTWLRCVYRSLIPAVWEAHPLPTY